MAVYILIPVHFLISSIKLMRLHMGRECFNNMKSQHMTVSAITCEKQGRVNAWKVYVV